MAHVFNGDLPDFLEELSFQPVARSPLFPDFQFEGMAFGTTDYDKKSLDDCVWESIAYEKALNSIGLYQPITDYHTGEILANQDLYNFWQDPSHRSAIKDYTSTPVTSQSSSAGSPIFSQSSTFSLPAALSYSFPQFRQFTEPRPSYSTMTGTGVVYTPIKMATDTEISSRNESTGWVNANSVATTPFNNASHHDDNHEYETSSVDSSSYFHDSPSALGENSVSDASLSGSGSNVVAVDDINDTTSQYSTHSDDSEDADATAQCAIKCRLNEGIDHETHLLSGDIITTNGNIVPIGPTLAKPKIAFNKLKKSPIANMLPEFLAQMDAANKDLEAEIAAGNIHDSRIEIDETTANAGQYIEMNLGLGVLEEVADESSSNEDSVGQGVMETLMGTRKRRFNDEDDDDAVVGEQKKMKIIEEI